MSESIDQQTDESKIQPRTLRLIKLISSNTTSDQTRQAIKLLSITASRSSPIVLWDIIYRLYSSLIHPQDDSKGGCSITRRENVALAMEYVAHYIPKSDRDHFLYDTNDSIYSNEENNHRFLTVNSLFETYDGLTTLQRVLKEGKLLLSCNESKYNLDNSADGNSDDLILSNHFVSMQSKNVPISKIVEERVKLQKSILAYRMGIGGLESCLQIEDFTPDLHSLIPEKELPFETACSKLKQENESTDTKKLSTRERNRERLRKKRKTEITSTDQSEPIDTIDDLSPTRTLLLQSLHNQSNASASRHLSQKDPQTVLAADLMFYSFSSQWHIRHGSLLGLLALLKSWYPKSQGPRNQERKLPLKLGRWPQDILTRCLCIIGLDRFNDFSGLSFESIHQAIDSRNVGIAPVRDTAAQIISFLFLNSIEIKDKCIRAMIELMDYEPSWEVRQGSIITLKWIVSMSTSKIEFIPSDLFIKLINKGLNDKSDEVRSSAAQLLSTLISSNHEPSRNLNHLIQSTSASLWLAIGSHQVSAGTTIGILQTFADCLKQHCDIVVKSIGCDLSEVLDGICDLLKSPSESILLCCLEILPLITDAIKSSDSFSSISIHPQFSIIEVLFDFYMSAIGTHDTGVTETTDNESFLFALDNAWKSLILALKFTLTGCQANDLRRLLRSLLGKLCGLDCQIGPASYVIDSQLGWTYIAVERSAGAFTLFLKVISPFLSESKHLVTSMLLSLINSPCYEDCERGCILLRNYISETNPSSTELDIFSRILHSLLESGPICLGNSEATCVKDRGSCKSILKEYLFSSPMSLSDAINQSQAVTQACTKLMSSNGRDTHYIVRSSVSIAVTTMRLSASVAQVFSALSHSYLPVKMTPLVRSFVTHLKNEECKERVDVTASAAISLISTLRNSLDTSQNKVAGKMIKSICRLVPTDSVKCGVCTLQGSECAISIVQGLVQTLKTTEPFDSLEEIWRTVSPILQEHSQAHDEKSHEEALWMLSIVSKYLRKDSSSYSQLASTFLSAVTVLACSSGSIVSRNYATEILKNFCSVDAVTSFPVILRLASQYLHTEDDASRLGSTVLLNQLVKTSELSICPFIRTLLPIAMSMMIDNVKEIADLSANTFSKLVYLSPLVPENGKKIDVDLGHWNKKSSDDVIDHLIHGKPLPICSFPDRLLYSMEVTGIQLRKYQIDGIAWLKFLQDVKLHGALCDDMGLVGYDTLIVTIIFLFDFSLE